MSDCECLCELTAAGSRTIHVHIANSVTVGATAFSVTAAGEGITIYPGTEHNVGLTGNDPNSITGAGDTSPHAGTGRSQRLYQN